MTTASGGGIVVLLDPARVPVDYFTKGVLIGSRRDTTRKRGYRTPLNTGARAKGIYEKPYLRRSHSRRRRRGAGFSISPI